MFVASKNSLKYSNIVLFPEPEDPIMRYKLRLLLYQNERPLKALNRFIAHGKLTLKSSIFMISFCSAYLSFSSPPPRLWHKWTSL